MLRGLQVWSTCCLMLFVGWGQQSGNLEGGGLLHNVVDTVSMDREESIIVTTLWGPILAGDIYWVSGSWTTYVPRCCFFPLEVRVGSFSVSSYLRIDSLGCAKDLQKTSMWPGAWRSAKGTIVDVLANHYDNNCPARVALWPNLDFLRLCQMEYIWKTSLYIYIYICFFVLIQKTENIHNHIISLAPLFFMDWLSREHDETTNGFSTFQKKRRTPQMFFFRQFLSSLIILQCCRSIRVL